MTEKIQLFPFRSQGLVPISARVIALGQDEFSKAKSGQPKAAKEGISNVSSSKKRSWIRKNSDENAAII
jgi:hypothetical protein